MSTSDGRRPFIVGLGGTVRPSSSSERALKKALEAAEALGATTQLFDGPFLAGLPIYNPSDPACEGANGFLAAVAACDGVIVSSPGYHGSISGLVKNALDTLEGLREDRRPYFDGRAVGLIVAAEGWQATASTLAALRGIVHAMRGWPTPLGATLNSAGGLFDEADAFKDTRDAWQVNMVAQQVVDFANRWPN
ncbi:NADPH-dependent FMN reductase [Caulobacter sp. KR2-114]|uniref:NADPH-dependent FMN reductase n=1 Tax=Caulobacter sp. KR2-114 TaxID=3400912 RepID=UPI003C0104F7